jgi:large conductance mechanosensitive channel
MGFVKEFRDFAVRGNVVDMAVGIIIGAAFGKIVASMVGDVIMPVVSKATGGLDFTEMFYALDGQEYATLAAAKEAGAATLNYGVFLTTVVDFVIIAFVIFLMIKQMNRLKQEAPPPAPTTRDCPQCFMSVPKQAKRCGHCTSELKPA